ncbi:MAG: glycosyltransferase [Solirubrobacteraceae bacterium]
MPLRLTGTTLKPSGPSAADPVSLPADSLARRAFTLLGAGDIDAFAKLFADGAAAREDPQRRFEAQLALLDAGLRASAGVSAAVATRLFVALADAALEILEETPSEPVLLNLAGVACYELWSLDGAEALFKAALRLDDASPEARRNLAQLARRRREAARMRRPLHNAVPALTRRAKTVARRAKPAKGMTLSLCMIVRDEEQMLPRCLAAAAPAVDEIVVVDTGSTDATVEIARSFGARVIEHQWTGSFSEARNLSFEAATGDWLVYLDADEVLEAQDVPALRALTTQTWREAFYLVETSWLGELGDGSSMVNNALRVFRNRPQYRFRDRLHEQIYHTLPSFVPGRIADSSVRVSHYGYLGSVRNAKEKSLRNVQLLRKQAAESAPTPFLHFNLGSEYAAAGDHRAAAIEFERARAMLVADGDLRTCHYGAPLLSRLVTVLRLCGRIDDAGAMADDALAMFPELTELVLAQGRIAQSRGDFDDAVALFGRCIEMGDPPSHYGAMVGCGTFLPRLALAELELGRGDPAAACAQLAWCVEHHPEFLAVAGPYATALVRAGVAPSDALAELERLDSLPGVVRLAIAVALADAGAREVAIEQFHAGLATTPDNHRARTALAETLLGTGAWDEASEQARIIPPSDAFGAVAARIECLGVIGRGGVPATETALRHAREAGLSAAEQGVLSTWAALAAGAQPSEPLPVSGAPLLGVALETLLRGGDTERFQALLPVLEGSRLAERERRELLAQMYLSAGMLARAANEWLKACTPAPDVRALLGLARVSECHGMPDDAVNFATGALELDPGCAPARELLARIGADAMEAPVAA